MIHLNLNLNNMENPWKEYDEWAEKEFEYIENNSNNLNYID